MYFITFDGTCEKDKALQMNMLERYLVNNRVTNNVINMVSPGFFKDEISKLYHHFITSSSISVMERFFLQLSGRARELEQLLHPSFYERYNLKNSIVLCPHSPEGIEALYGYGFKIGTTEQIVPIIARTYQPVNISLSVVIESNEERALNSSALSFKTKDGGLNFYRNVGLGLKSLVKDRQKVYGRARPFGTFNGMSSTDELHNKISQFVVSSLRHGSSS